MSSWYWLFIEHVSMIDASCKDHKFISWFLETPVPIKFSPGWQTSNGNNSHTSDCMCLSQLEAIVIEVSSVKLLRLTANL